MIADEIIEVTDKEMREYESTGRKMEAPKMSAKVKAMRVAQHRAKHSNQPAEISAPVTTPMKEPSLVAAPIMDIPAPKKVFVHIKNPDDQQALLTLKQVCGNFVGHTDIILVLGADKKSAIRLPFRVDGSVELVGELVKVLGEDCVALK
ncbi:MAG: hypothetical protein ABIR91_00765 [Candidatus Saccharimonadales bacterium]